ncbi:hypothetical protein DM01DRAFT_1361468 [Hesseltinella vesiculosa]|uniref:PEP5/VPS11 N-terminal domain-containing protein n=1 Tax=Hesseltinella vesiculosa TaxID=101127 RepID=A0A1X2GS96_9FUNG|nr:hypothetical protein DM01DRAFT_1361468 [Hesseltinella vesiculosa]
MSLLAIGLGNGTVLLYRLDLLKDKVVKKIIYEGQEPITGLLFREQSKSTILFITTTTNVLSYNTSASKLSIVTLDEQGCGLGCAIMNDTQEMVVGRDEAIYFYDPTGRGPCLAYDSPKSYLLWFKSNYLIIVSPPTNAPARSNDLSKITVFDTINKFVAYSGTFSGGIRGVFCEWNAIWIVGHDSKLYRLEEKDTPTKLEILFKLNLYMLAINLAHMQKYDAASIADIFKKYGDHLYSRANYDGAMDQYIRTIGQMEPSYVIRKYLDAQRIYNLTSYLQELHAKGLANADHTTLLLNCYTKLKDVSRLDQFIKTDEDLNFDLETAINVCRQAGYYEHAIYLAEKFQEHDLYLDIAIEDMRDYETAIQYLRKCGPAEADKHLQKYNKTLLGHLPDETTQLLVDLCSGQLPLAGKSDAPVTKSDTPAYRPPSVRTFMPSFVDHPDYLVRFLEQILEWRWKRSTPTLAPPSTNGSIASPSPALPLLENSMAQPALSRQEEEERKAIWNTLLELYLMDEQQPMPGTTDPSNQRWQRSKEVKTKALALLKDDQVAYDTNQALMLCQLKKFDEGIVYLHEKTAMYADIVRFWMEKQETDRVIEAVRKYGPKDSSIYPLVLTYFSSTPEILAKSTTELLSVLRHIDEQDLLPPIQVVQALSRSNVATIGLFKDYIGRKIDEERKELDQNQALIQSYREETEKRRKEIEDLQTT